MRSALFNMPAVMPAFPLMHNQSAPRSASYNSLCMRHGEITS